jgi:hypothetical protein
MSDNLSRAMRKASKTGRAIMSGFLAGKAERDKERVEQLRERARAVAQLSSQKSVTNSK